MPLEYRVPLKDTGYNYNASIQPIDNGEPANEDTYRRPSENLRTRTEDIRSQYDALEAVIASDRGLTIMADKDTYVTWNSGAGTFTVDDNAPAPTDRDMWVTPMLGTATKLGGSAIQAQWVYKEGANGFKVGANTSLRDFGDFPLDATKSGANNIHFKLIQGAPGTVSVYTEGDEDTSKTFPADGPVTVVIEYDPTPVTGSTFSDIVTEIQTTVDAKVQAYLDYATAATIGAGGTLVTGTVDDPQRIYDGAVGTYPDTSMAAVDAQAIKITPAMWTSFWATYTSLAEGDMAVINFTDAVDRLNNKNLSDMSNMLVKVDANSALLGNRQVVPVCKVFGSRLYFVNGRGFDHNEPGKLVSDPGAAEAEAGNFAQHVAGTAFKHADGDITSADISSSPRSLTGVQVRGQLTAILGHYNSHVGDGTQDKHTDAVIDSGAKGGVDPTTSIDSTLGAGNIGSQMALLNDRYRTTAGGANVGATQKTGTGANKTLPSYTTQGQLQGLLNYYDNHIFNTTPVDKHTMRAIDAKPFVVVDSTAGQGDYQTIVAAVAGKGTARYVINPGTYQELLGVSTDDDILMFEAASLGAVLWVAPAGLNLFQANNNSNASYYFKNIVFYTDETAAMFLLGGTANGLSFVFENCAFMSGSLTTSQIASLTTTGANNNIEFHRCSFENDSAVNGAFGIQTATATALDVVVDHCAIDGYRTFLKYDNDNNNYMGQFRFTHNRMKNCAYTKSDGLAFAPFIHMTCSAGSDHLDFSIIGNTWVTNTLTQEESGNLCRLFGSGSISHNRFLQPIGYNVSASPEPFIFCSNGDAAFLNKYGVSVIGNQFYHEKGAAVFLLRGQVIGNDIYNVTYASGLEGVVQASQVSGNYIHCDSHGSNISAVIFANHGEVCGNRIQADDNVKGIHVRGGTCKITGNSIYLNGNSTNGVYLDGTQAGTTSDFTYRCVVSGNEISGAFRGIYADGISNDDDETPWDATMHCITGNTIKLPVVDFCVGIEVFKPYMVITGNIITSDNWSDAGTHGEGIELNNHAHIALSGNMLMPGLTTDINGAGGAGVGVGASGAVNLDHNWRGYAWLVPL
jgi:hypothetical protein